MPNYFSRKWKPNSSLLRRIRFSDLYPSKITLASPQPLYLCSQASQIKYQYHQPLRPQTSEPYLLNFKFDNQINILQIFNKQIHEKLLLWLSWYLRYWDQLLQEVEEMLSKFQQIHKWLCTGKQQTNKTSAWWENNLVQQSVISCVIYNCFNNPNEFLNK